MVEVSPKHPVSSVRARPGQLITTEGAARSPSRPRWYGAAVPKGEGVVGAADRGQARPDALGPRTGGLDRDGDTGSGIPSAIALRCAGVLLLISAMIVPLATTGVVAARGNVAVRELAFSRIAYALAVSVIVVSTAAELTPRLRYPAR